MDHPGYSRRLKANNASPLSHTLHECADLNHAVHVCEDLTVWFG